MFIYFPLNNFSTFKIFYYSFINCCSILKYPVINSNPSIINNNDYIIFYLNSKDIQSVRINATAFIRYIYVPTKDQICPLKQETCFGVFVNVTTPFSLTALFLQLKYADTIHSVSALLKPYSPVLNAG